MGSHLKRLGLAAFAGGWLAILAASFSPIWTVHCDGHLIDHDYQDSLWLVMQDTMLASRREAHAQQSNHVLMFPPPTVTVGHQSIALGATLFLLGSLAGVWFVEVWRRGFEDGKKINTELAHHRTF